MLTARFFGWKVLEVIEDNHIKGSNSYCLRSYIRYRGSIATDFNCHLDLSFTKWAVARVVSHLQNLEIEKRRRYFFNGETRHCTGEYLAPLVYTLQGKPRSSFGVEVTNLNFG